VNNTLKKSIVQLGTLYVRINYSPNATNPIWLCQ